MKQSPTLTRIQNSRGYATVAVVTSVSLLIISMMTLSLQGSLTSMNNQVHSQLKQDYSQKEDAILNALLHIVPNKAIGAMQQGSASKSDNLSWDTIFTEALNLANVEQAVDPQLLAGLGLSNAITANSGDAYYSSAGDFVLSPAKTHAGGSSLVNGGNWWEYKMLYDDAVGPYVPAPMMVSYSDYLLDKDYPIISHNKKHVFNYKAYNDLYYKDINVSSDAYPLFNQLTYPDVKFGYRRPGDLFVAKRNWWTFSLTFGRREQLRTGLPPVTKTYVLSIYEIPSQLPLSASALMKVGRFADGTDWENISVDGGIYAGALETEGDVALGSGSISARESVSLSSNTSVDGRSVASNFDDVGEREERALTSDSDFYDVSLGGDVGKVVFIPLNTGADFLKRSTDGDPTLRISPTGWKDYSRGANQAAMHLEVTRMNSIDDQTPVEAEFHYLDTSGAEATKTYLRGDNWPTEAEDTANAFPFHTTHLENGRSAIAVYLDRLPAFLGSIADAASLSHNHSILVNLDSDQATVKETSIPSTDDDFAVTLRGGADMSAYSKGFSLVTDLRLYVAESLNNVPVTPPTGSAIPDTGEYYPPLSLFAPEKRFGESPDINNTVDLRGQISTLKTSTGDTFNPLDIKGADDTRLEAEDLDADLIAMNSPAELPPIHLMNWMITVEEVHNDGKISNTPPPINPGEAIASSYTGTSIADLRAHADALYQSATGDLRDRMKKVRDHIDDYWDEMAQGHLDHAIEDLEKALDDVDKAVEEGVLSEADADNMSDTLDDESAEVMIFDGGTVQEAYDHIYFLKKVYDGPSKDKMEDVEDLLKDAMYLDEGDDDDDGPGARTKYEDTIIKLQEGLDEGLFDSQNVASLSATLQARINALGGDDD